MNRTKLYISITTHDGVMIKIDKEVDADELPKQLRMMADMFDPSLASECATVTSIYALDESA